MKYIGIILLVLGAIGAVAQLFTPEKPPPWFKWSMVALIGIGLVLSIQKERIDGLEKASAANAGTLTATGETNQPNVVDYQIGSRTNGTIIQCRGNTSLLDILFAMSAARDPAYADLIRRNKLFVNVRNGRLYVNTSLTTKKGLLVEIVDNEWKVRPDRFDRNFTDTAFEVKNEDGEIVLKLILQQDRVAFEGQFQISEKTGTLIHDAGNGARIEFLFDHKPYFEGRIVPYFRYPSELHFGEIAKQDDGPNTSL